MKRKRVAGVRALMQVGLSFDVGLAAIGPPCCVNVRQAEGGVLEKAGSTS